MAIFEACSPREIRIDRREVVRFMEKDQGEWPKTALIDPQIKRYISGKIDKIIFDECQLLFQKIRESAEYAKYLIELSRANKNCGEFKKSKEILKNYSPLEQMVVLGDFIAIHQNRWLKGVRTFCFYNGEDHLLPVYVMSSSTSKASLMKTRLGSSRGQYKAPTYEELSKGDGAPEYIFSRPLEALEVVRQPYFSGATVIKGNAWEVETITDRRRFEIKDEHDETRISQFACVEIPRQNLAKNIPVKVTSVASNIFSLARKHIEERLVKPVRYEEIAPEGYRDDLDFEVTAQDLWDALKRSVVSERGEDLINICRSMLFLKFAPFSSLAINEWYCKRLIYTSTASKTDF